MKLFLSIFLAVFSCAAYAQKIDYNPNRDPIKKEGPTSDFERPPQKMSSVVIRDGNSSSAQILYILNGKVISNNEFSAINPKIIESVTVLKPEDAILIYGEKARNGVIVVKTKKTKRKEKSEPASEPILAI